ncbi:uncharacterized protein LOC110852397 isoform X2 [Folsomia candida]|uniref:Uncharacterized protein n=1 Tax=Folsomia candida TaxID=158441 RepID=A0A226E558_FOLCA|nr:uncharacterized protein LOC110852397 isoform X2 [Folsomia candida]OXA52194.1 hypothetical protein Fcan01_13107 [Folsomia candida]
MIFVASEFNVRVVLGFKVESFNIIDVLKPCSYTRTGEMSSIPMGAFAAYKVRDNNNSGASAQERTFSFQAQSTASSEMKCDQPEQYNGKLMKAVWGIYNRYSVHNIKSHIAFDKA